MTLSLIWLLCSVGFGVKNSSWPFVRLVMMNEEKTEKRVGLQGRVHEEKERTG